MFVNDNNVAMIFNMSSVVLHQTITVVNAIYSETLITRFMHHRFARIYIRVFQKKTFLKLSFCLLTTHAIGL